MNRDGDEEYREGCRKQQGRSIRGCEERFVKEKTWKTLRAYIMGASKGRLKSSEFQKCWLLYRSFYIFTYESMHMFHTFSACLYAIP